MQICSLSIRNFRTIRQLTIGAIEDAMIVVGKNNTGKSTILAAILAAVGEYSVEPEDFTEEGSNIEIGISLKFTKVDLESFRQLGLVSKYKREEVWTKDFYSKLPSLKENILTFTFVANQDGKIRYDDGYKKHNPYIPQVLPRIRFIGHDRKIADLEEEILLSQDRKALAGLRENTCMFDRTKRCKECFQCYGVIAKKPAEELSVLEAAKLLEYKIYHLNLDSMSEKMNRYFHKNNGNAQDINYSIEFDFDAMVNVKTSVIHKIRGTEEPVGNAGAGTKSIYILSLLEAYAEDANSVSSIIMMEDPEIYLHPQMQKVASEILYRLSKKNQVIFSTYSPNMIFNFTSGQLKQVVLDQNYNTTVREDADIDEILDDLGYSANDLMNVSFLFLVEGKQDRSRLPLLLEQYYSEIYDEEGRLARIAIISTNSCTNIKTYANLKYMNQLYIKDQFLMIRDSDGKDPQMLTNQLCSYYRDRAKADQGTIPRVTPRNVLILKYYSFENYFLDPAVMAEIGVVRSEQAFYDILYDRYRQYLYKLSSFQKLCAEKKLRIRSAKDIRENMELIRIYVRGHNLYDIFYGRYKGERETEILKQYIAAAPRSTFADILEAIDKFVYFDSRKYNR
ncbi:MAG: AAA family ATPase [Lachnospiraceae bacterium]|nr:AAA family ATPase [Lachnospiraceae bacterium]